MKLSVLLSSPISFVLFVLPTLIHAQTPLAANNFNFIGSTPTQRIYINQTQAQAVISAAAGKALGFSPSNIAVTDPSGLLVAFLRGDNAYPASIDISIKKARTVSLFNGGLTTAQLYNASVPGGTLYGRCLIGAFFPLRAKRGWFGGTELMACEQGSKRRMAAWWCLEVDCQSMWEGTLPLQRIIRYDCSSSLSD
jgi:hypothetical protein